MHVTAFSSDSRKNSFFPFGKIRSDPILSDPIHYTIHYTIFPTEFSFSRPYKIVNFSRFILDSAPSFLFLSFFFFFCSFFFFFPSFFLLLPRTNRDSVVVLIFYNFYARIYNVRVMDCVYEWGGAEGGRTNPLHNTNSLGRWFKRITRFSRKPLRNIFGSFLVRLFIPFWILFFCFCILVFVSSFYFFFTRNIFYRTNVESFVRINAIVDGETKREGEGGGKGREKKIKKKKIKKNNNKS